jgi:peroxiredoxin
MKTLIFMLGFILSCTQNKTSNNNSETGIVKQVEEEIEEPVGIIPAEDCQQINRGDKACNFKLLDQNGVVWELYDYEGDIILLDFSTMWCYPCQLAGHYMQPLQDDYASKGVQIVTVLIDGLVYDTPPSENEIDEWVTVHNITTAPVLQASRELMYDNTGVEGYLIGSYPTYVYINRDMEFYNAHVGYSDEYVRQAIEEGLNL